MISLMGSCISSSFLVMHSELDILLQEFQLNDEWIIQMMKVKLPVLFIAKLQLWLRGGVPSSCLNGGWGRERKDVSMWQYWGWGGNMSREESACQSCVITVCPALLALIKMCFTIGTTMICFLCSLILPPGVVSVSWCHVPHPAGHSASAVSPLSNVSMCESNIMIMMMYFEPAPTPARGGIIPTIQYLCGAIYHLDPWLVMTPRLFKYFWGHERCHLMTSHVLCHIYRNLTEETQLWLSPNTASCHHLPHINVVDWGGMHDKNTLHPTDYILGVLLNVSSDNSQNWPES